jgi:hypothetical protein
VLAFGLYASRSTSVRQRSRDGGFLADRSFLYIFVADALTSFAYGVIALVALPHGVRTAAHEEQAGDGYRAVLGDRRFVYFLSATMCLTWVDFQIMSTLPIHVAKAGFSPSQYGMLISLNGVLIVVFELALTAWTQRLQAQPLIAAGYFLNCAGIALTGLVTSMTAPGDGCRLDGGEMITRGEQQRDEPGPERLRGRYHGLRDGVFRQAAARARRSGLRRSCFERSETGAMGRVRCEQRVQGAARADSAGERLCYA